MPDLKILVGGRNYNISCNPGEESAANESAHLLDEQAELIQDQLGRLPEDKMLLLSGLLLGDKIRALKHERTALEETLRATQTKLTELGTKTPTGEPSAEGTQDLATVQSCGEDKSKIISLQNISDLLDGLIRTLETSVSSETKKKAKQDTGIGDQRSLL